MRATRQKNELKNVSSIGQIVSSNVYLIRSKMENETPEDQVRCGVRRQSGSVGLLLQADCDGDDDDDFAKRQLNDHVRLKVVSPM